MQKSISQLKLETTAHYQAKSKLNVRFFQQDMNTAELKFLITRDNFPLSLSSENVVIIIAMQQGKNFISSDEFIVSSEIDGVASFMIPNDFLSSVNGTVEAQVYVGTKDNDQVVVERPFTFEVSNDLLSTIPSELKLQYIKTFSDLRQDVQDRITALENEFVVMEDYVVAVQQATTDGLNQLNNLVNAKLVEYNDNHADKLAIIDSTVGNYVDDFLTQRTYIDTQYNDFKQQLLQSDVVVQDDTTNWQKYKMTNDDGSRIYFAKDVLANINTLGAGFYEIIASDDAVAQGFPDVQNNASIMELDITVGPYNGRKQMKTVQNYNGRTWVKHIHTDGVDGGWKEMLLVNDVASIETALGSQAKANTAENNAKAYVDTEMADVHTTIFSGSVQNVNQVVNLSESLYNFEMVVISGNAGGNDFSQVFIPSIIGSVFNIQQFNLRDSDGLLLGMYECRLEMTSNTKIKITTDVAYDHPSDSGSGPNRNAYTISRVDGFVRKT